MDRLRPTRRWWSAPAMLVALPSLAALWTVPLQAGSGPAPQPSAPPAAWHALRTAQRSPAVPPQRVMSLNLCTDALALELLPPWRITSVTYLAHRSTDPTLAAEAARVGINHGSPEEVQAQAPDLVLLGSGSTPAVRSLLQRMHAPMLVLPPANSFEEIRRQVRRVARVMGVAARGETLIARMDRTLSSVERDRPTRPIRVVAWSGDGYVPGKGTLFDAVLEAAGGINVAATSAGDRTVSFGIEQLLMARPDVLLYGDDQPSPSLQSDSADHPLVLRLYAGRRITYPQLPIACGLPQSARTAQQLQRALERVVGRTERRLPHDGNMP